MDFGRTFLHRAAVLHFSSIVAAPALLGRRKSGTLLQLDKSVRALRGPFSFATRRRRTWPKTDTRNRRRFHLGETAISNGTGMNVQTSHPFEANGDEAPIRVRTLFISDIHLGTRGCQAEKFL